MVYFNINKNKIQPSKTNTLVGEKLSMPRKGPGFSNKAVST
jgi:hypothetical protein